jgi:hypothetical protein
MIKRFVVCCTTAAITIAPMSAQCQSFEPSLQQQLNSIIIESQINGIGLQNTLPPSRRAPGYGNTSSGTTKPYNFSGSNQSSNLNYTGTFARYARAANIPMRDPSSSMAMQIALGWSIANGVELSENNPIHVAGLRSLQQQSLATMRRIPDTNDANVRQIVEEQLRKTNIMLDSLRVSIRDRQDASEIAELSDSVHSVWQQKFGINLRSVILTKDGLVSR